MRVAYVYRSKASAAQTVTMAFPFPAVPVGEGPDSIIFNDDKNLDVRNFMNFERQTLMHARQARMVGSGFVDGKSQKVGERSAIAAAPGDAAPAPAAPGDAAPAAGTDTSTAAAEYE